MRVILITVATGAFLLLAAAFGYQKMVVMAAGCNASPAFALLCPMYQFFAAHPMVYSAVLGVGAFIYGITVAPNR